MTIEFEPIGWVAGDTKEYNKNKWRDGSIHGKLHGEYSGTFTLRVELEGKPIPRSDYEWRVEVCNRPTVSFPQRPTIVDGGEGYVSGDRVVIGGTHHAVVDLTKKCPKKGSIYQLTSVRLGEASPDVTDEVEGGSGKGARIRFPEENMEYTDGMLIKIYVHLSSKQKPYVVKIQYGDGKQVVSPHFYVVSKGVPIEKKKERKQQRMQIQMKKKQQKQQKQQQKQKRKKSRALLSASASTKAKTPRSRPSVVHQPFPKKPRSPKPCGKEEGPMGSPPQQQQPSLSDPFFEDSSLFDFVFPTDDPFSGAARHSDLPTREPSPIEMLKESNRQLLESNRKLMGLMQDYNHRMELMESTMKQIADTMSISSRVRS
jgi:hypothetical protein